MESELNWESINHDRRYIFFNELCLLITNTAQVRLGQVKFYCYFFLKHFGAFLQHGQLLQYSVF